MFILRCSGPVTVANHKLTNCLEQEHDKTIRTPGFDVLIIKSEYSFFLPCLQSVCCFLSSLSDSLVTFRKRTRPRLPASRYMLSSRYQITSDTKEHKVHQCNGMLLYFGQQESGKPNGQEQCDVTTWSALLFSGFTFPLKSTWLPGLKF